MTMDALDKARLQALLERVSEDEDDFSYDDEKKSMFAIRACVELMIEWEVENAWEKLEDVKEHLCDDDIEEWLQNAMDRINKDSLKEYIDTLVRHNEAHKLEIKRLQETTQTLRTALNDRDDGYRQMQREVSDLEFKVTSYEHTLDAHKRRMADLKLEAEQAGIRVKELVQQNDQQGAKIRQLNADLAKAIADRAILNDQKRQTAALLESMEAKIKELDDDVKARECCVNNQETVIIARDKEIAALQKRILDLEHGNGYRAQD